MTAPSFAKTAFPGDVVEVVMGVDDKLDGQLGDHADFAEESLRGGFVFEGIDYRDTAVADDKAGVGAGFAFGVVNRSVDALAERLQEKGRAASGLGAGAVCADAGPPNQAK